MFWHALRHPEGEGGGGAPEGAPTPTPETNSPAPTPEPPESQPSGRYVSDDEYQKFQRYQQQAAGSQKVYNQFRDLGFEDMDSAIGYVQRYKQMESDPKFGHVLEALQNPPQPDTPNTPDGQGSGLTEDRILELLNQQLEQRDQQAFQQQHRSAAEMENNLLGEFVKRDSFKDIFGEHSYDQAFQGEAGPVAQAVAAMIEAKMLQHADRYDGGQLKPITDRQVFDQIANELGQQMSALRANTILSGSRDTANQSIQPSQSTQQNTVTNNEPQYKSNADIARERAEAARRTFEEQFRNASASGPLSQM